MQGGLSGYLHLKSVRPEPTPWGRKSLCCHNHVQNHQLCSLALLVHLSSASFPCSSHRGGCQQGLGKKLSPSSLELAIFTSAWVLVLSSSPFLPLQMCLLLELLPPDSQVSWELSLKKKKKKPVPRWASPGSWGSVPGISLPAMPTSPWAQNKPKPSLSVDDALL